MSEDSSTIGDRVGTAKFAELMKRARESEGDVPFNAGGWIGGAQRVVNDTGQPIQIRHAADVDPLKDED